MLQKSTFMEVINTWLVINAAVCTGLPRQQNQSRPSRGWITTVGQCHLTTDPSQQDPVGLWGSPRFPHSD